MFHLVSIVASLLVLVYDNTLRLWDVETGKLIKTLIGDSNHVFSNGSFSVNKCLLASASQRDVRLWDVETGKYIEILTGYTEDVERVWLGVGGRCVIAIRTCYGSRVELWDVETGKYIVTLVGDTNHVFHIVSFNSNNRIFASAGLDKRLRLWDMETGELIKTLSGHTGEIESIVFSSDGRTLASGSKDGTVLLWDVTPVSEKTIVVEEESEFQHSTSEIQHICEHLGITTLCHFTRIENLRSILQEGLIGQSFLQTRGQQFLWNDADRADGHPEANCLSISFPNYQMFYSIREGKKQAEGVSDSQWVVLLLDAKVLWELNCAFCQRNAAHRTVSGISLAERKKPQALKGMFEDFYNIKHQDLQIPQNYPTHPQAEVLVFDRIPTHYINAIHFGNATILEQWRSNYTGTYSDKFFANRKYFDARSDYKVWSPNKFNNDGIPLSYFSDGNNKDSDVFILNPDSGSDKDVDDKDDFEDDIPF